MFNDHKMIEVRFGRLTVEQTIALSTFSNFLHERFLRQLQISLLYIALKQERIEL
jgi:hypothetical protein